MYQLGRILTRSMFLVIFGISSLSQTITTFSEFSEVSTESDSYFIVTAYYSPLADQDEYITGSYQGDIRLNGSGIRGASGKEVFPGMIAAPKKYAFGTKIYIEGLGVGSVEDRGGAIIEASDGGPSHDRLDVWMGFGDEGRKRAIVWGARKVKGEVVDIKSEINIAFSASLGLELFGTSVGPDSHTEDIKKLQEFLVSLKIYSGKVDGEHNSIRDTIIDYQLKHGIIKSASDEEAGYFGRKTIATIKKEFPTVSLKTGKKQETEKQEKSIVFNSILSKNVSKESKKTEIKELQKFLKYIGLYNGKEDGSYESVKESLIDYQIKKKIISSKESFGAGVFGPKTRSTIKKEFASVISQKKTDILDKTISPREIPKINIHPGSSEENIKVLQGFLQSINLYSGELDGKYDSVKTVIIKYQLEKKIIKTKDDEAAGYFGPKTREKLQQDLREIARK